MAFSDGRQKRKLDDLELYDYAIASLARKMRTVAELKRLLRARAPDNDDGALAVEAVIQKLKERKYLNDTSYAVSYSQYRQSNQKFGRRRVIADLKQKGVHSDVIEQAVTSSYEDVNEERLARQFLDRKGLGKPNNERESARIFRTLIRAGFAAGTIFKVLRKWKVDDQVLDQLESESEQSTIE